MNCGVVVAVLTVPDRLFQIVAPATANVRSYVLMDVSGFLQPYCLCDLYSPFKIIQG